MANGKCKHAFLITTYKEVHYELQLLYTNQILATYYGECLLPYNQHFPLLE